MAGQPVLMKPRRTGVPGKARCAMVLSVFSLLRACPLSWLRHEPGSDPETLENAPAHGESPRRALRSCSSRPSVPAYSPKRL